MSIQVSLAKNPEENWDRALTEHGGSVFLSYAWLTALADHDKSPIFLNFYKEGKMVALLSGLIRPIKNSHEKQLFFYSGIVLIENSIGLSRDAKKALVDFSIKNNYSRVIIKSYDYYNYLPAKLKFFSEFKREECIIDLTYPEEKLIKGFTKNVRRNVRKAKKNGAVFSYTQDPKFIDHLFSLTKQTIKVREKKGYGGYRVLTMPFMGEKEMAKLLQAKTAIFFYVTYKEEIVSMQFAILKNNRAYGLLMGTSPLGYQVSAPSVVFFEGAMFLYKKNFRGYNLGGVPLGKNKGIKKFKLDMGSELVLSSEETTRFLQPPLKKYNILLMMENRLLSLPLPGRLKHLGRKILHSLLNGRQHY
jgi:hypothetical protein